MGRPLALRGTARRGVGRGARNDWEEAGDSLSEGCGGNKVRPSKPIAGLVAGGGFGIEGLGGFAAGVHAAGTSARSGAMGRPPRVPGLGWSGASSVRVISAGDDATCRQNGSLRPPQPDS